MTKILYIAGSGRSGTTLLGNLLGLRDGFTSTGELHYLWQRGLAEDRKCGCGLLLKQCDVWNDIFDAGFGGRDRIDVAAVIRSQAPIHTRHAPAALRTHRAGRTLETYEYARHLGALYDGIAKVTGARVIVDSSKFPTDAILAAGLPDHEVYVLHMVRDPRAVAFSWAREKAVPDKTKNRGLLSQIGLVRSTLVWDWYNLTISSLVRRAVTAPRYRLVQYEELVADPQRIVHELVSFVGETVESSQLLQGQHVQMPVTHTASGNPNRFKSGEVRIKLDDEWKRELRPWKRSRVTALASPMLAVAGYKWRPRAI